MLASENRPRRTGSDAAAGTGSPRKDRCKQKAQHRAGRKELGREGPGRQSGQPAVVVNDGANRAPGIRIIGPRVVLHSLTH